MTLFAYLAGSDIGHRIRLNAFGLTSNADGSVGFGGIVFDDAAGNLTVRGWMKVVVKELACTSAPVLFSGYVGPRTYARNGEVQYRVSGARFIDTTLVDENSVLHIRLITGSDGKRPAETHNARINWLVASDYLSGLIDDVTLVDTSNPRPFEEADYRGQYADDVLSDIAAPIFRTFFIYNTQPTGGRGLFFDSPTTTTGTSTLRISNVLTDISATTFAPSNDATLTRDPSEVYAKVRYAYANGLVIENNATTRDTFFLDNGLGYRGLDVSNSRIGLESSARFMAQSILSRDDAENDTIAVTVQLPAASAGLIRSGQRLEVRFSHLPGYESFTFSRVSTVTIQQAEGNPDYYDLTLELNVHGLSGGGGGGAPAPGGFPHPAAAVGIVGSKFEFAAIGVVPNWASAFTPSVGDLLILMAVNRGVSTETAGPIAAGWTLIDSYAGGAGLGGGAAFYKVSNGTETTVTYSTNPNYYQVWGLSGADSATLVSNKLTGGGPGTAWTSGAVSVAASGFVSSVMWGGTDFIGSISFTPGAGWTEYGDSFGLTGTQHPHLTTVAQIAPSAGSYTPASTASLASDWRGITVAVGGSATASPPSPGQEVPWAVVTMAGAVGTTLYPYATGSLLVKVDGVLISRASYTETSPAAGTFTLSWTPATDEVVTVSYWGR